MANSLRDQLLKAGVVDKKAAARAAHDQRVENKAKGREGLQAEKAAREAKAEEDLKAQRARDKEREKQRKAEQEARDQAFRVAQIADTGTYNKRWNGPRMYYYETRDGRVPYLEISDEVQGLLDRGSLAIAESPDGEIKLIDREAAERIAALDAEWLRAWNRRSVA